MAAIYKREVKAYFTSMLGYVFMAINLLLTGVYFTYYNLQYAYPYMDYTLSGVSFIFMVTTPILTMKVMAEERRQRTDQLLLTSPVSPGKIVLGKYLALVTIFAVPIGVICCYPLLLLSFGEVSLKMAYTAIFGYFLAGCAYLALGLFLSSVTESPVLAAVITFGACFLCYMAGALSEWVSGTSFAAYIGLIVLSVFICIWVDSMTKSHVISGGVFLAAVIFLTICYFVKAPWMAGAIQRVIRVFDFNSPFNTFLSGIFDLKSILYYTSAAAVCGILTVQSIQKRRWS